jgi:hypothetical protein
MRSTRRYALALAAVLATALAACSAFPAEPDARQLRVRNVPDSSWSVQASVRDR